MYDNTFIKANNFFVDCILLSVKMQSKLYNGLNKMKSVSKRLSFNHFVIHTQSLVPVLLKQQGTSVN